MSLALFDLDNTLLNGDSDHSWGIFLAKIGAVDAQEQQLKQDQFYHQYLDGTLDMTEFLEYQLAPLTSNSIEQLHAWRSEFMQSIIQPMIDSGKKDLLEPHRNNGDKLVIITATNDFITRPIADALGVETLIATTVETENGRYTGRASGIPCFQKGKIKRLKMWLKTQEQDYSHSYFYSDSINDLPLLLEVDTPIAVTPDANLREHATKYGWKIID